MEKQINSTINEQDLIAAAEAIGEPFSPLSPFLFDLKTAVGMKPSADLFDRNGKPSAEALPVFQTLAQPANMGTCMFAGQGTLLDISFLYPQKGLRHLPAVSLLLTDEGMKLKSPSSFYDVLEWLEAHIGTAALQTVDLEVELSIQDTQVLFGILDSGRRVLLGKMAGTGGGKTEPIPKSAVDAALQIDLEDYQWIAPYFADGFSLSGISPGDLDTGLQRLADKRLIQVSGSSIIPNESLADLIANLLLLNGILRLQKNSVKNGNDLAGTEVNCVFGSSNSVLLWTHDGQNVHLTGASPAQVLMIARDILSDPNAPPEEEVQSRPADAVPAREDRYERAAVEKPVKIRRKRPWWLILLIVLGIPALVVFLLWFFAII